MLLSSTIPSVSNTWYTITRLHYLCDIHREGGAWDGGRRRGWAVDDRESWGWLVVWWASLGAAAIKLKRSFERHIINKWFALRWCSYFKQAEEPEGGVYVSPLLSPEHNILAPLNPMSGWEWASAPEQGGRGTCLSRNKVGLNPHVGHDWQVQCNWHHLRLIR